MLPHASTMEVIRVVHFLPWHRPLDAHLVASRTQPLQATSVDSRTKRVRSPLKLSSVLLSTPSSVHGLAALTFGLRKCRNVSLHLCPSWGSMISHTASRPQSYPRHPFDTAAAE